MTQIKVITLFIVLLFSPKAYTQTWISLDNTSPEIDISTNAIESSPSVYKEKVIIHGLYDTLSEKNGIKYHKIHFEQNHTLSFVGEPQLPVISRLIAIPEGASYEISVIQEKWQDIETGTIYPTQMDKKEASQIKDFYVIDSIYQKKVYAPYLVKTGSESRWRNIRNIPIRICPFRYYPNENRLSVMTEFVLQIDFKNASNKGIATKNDIEKAKKWHIFDNDVKDLPVKSRSSETNTYTDNYDYLIIVGNNSDILNCQALQDFKKWKAFKGLKTQIVSTSVTGMSADSIKDFIHHESLNKGIQYVLFIGDNDKIPMKRYTYYLGSNEYVKSDYWYGCFGGDQADVAIGRFSTNDVSEFQNMVNKSISYEKSFNGNTDVVLLVAHKEDAPGKYQECSENIKNMLYAEPITFHTAYGASISNFGDEATNAQVVDRINSGLHIVNYRGHGTTKSWGVSPFGEWNIYNEVFDSIEINYIDSCSIYFNVCCLTGNIEEEPCMMERLIRSPYKAIACLAATESVYTRVDDIYNQQLFCKLFNDSVFRIGDLNVQSHISTSSYYDPWTSEWLRWTFNTYSYLCGGDPSLEIWTKRPCTFTDINLWKQNGQLMISSTSLSQTDLISVVSENGELISKAGVINNVGIVDIPEGNFYIVLNKHNYYPFALFCCSNAYIQNDTITTKRYFFNTPINIGYNVTSEQPFGNVIIKNGGTLIIRNGAGGVTIKNGFECEKGAELIIE